MLVSKQEVEEMIAKERLEFRFDIRRRLHRIITDSVLCSKYFPNLAVLKCALNRRGYLIPLEIEKLEQIERDEKLYLEGDTSTQ